jgi:hypothetical protein
MQIAALRRLSVDVFIHLLAFAFAAKMVTFCQSSPAASAVGYPFITHRLRC